MSVDERPLEEIGPKWQPTVRVGYAFSMGRLSEARVMALAAAVPAGSTDPVDVALRESLAVNAPGVGTPVVDPEEYLPATPDRRYSLARVRAFRLAPDDICDVIVMRGAFSTVLGRVNNGAEAKSIARQNVKYARRRGRRALAVAVARVGDDGVVGEFRLEGFITVRTSTMVGVREGMASRPESWVRVNVWSKSLRFQHWINVAMIFILSCTGYYIMDPFFGPSATGTDSSGFLMGWVRFIHFCAAFVWLMVGITRLTLACVSRDPYLRWGAFWPLKSKQDVKNLGQVVEHYALIKDDAPLFLGHNPLQQLTYTAIYALCAVQMATGFMLFGLYHQDNVFWQIVSVPTHWVGVPFIRLVHAVIMFLLWVFVVIHVYLAIRADTLERHGGISAMINGGVWLRKGARPLDAPEVE